ncbi:hypothetical protein KZX50_17030 [Bacillus infantis]|uniref:hypothetical protein n=1 Tax=Bacillus infantis TaxID=324767 RepID=UPI002003F427|nr:hypothetical protein [Bacillus infantis]MCK6207144.1 hypothetical protein [Bacillus infantis]
MDKDRISSEANELYIEHIDDSLIPQADRVGLPQNLIFETMLYEDIDEIEWMGAIALGLVDRQWRYLIIIKDGVAILRKKL